MTEKEKQFVADVKAVMLKPDVTEGDLQAIMEKYDYPEITPEIRKEIIGGAFGNRAS
jgi:hypothetical protein